MNPLPVKPGGTIGFLAVCHSVRPSVCLSVRLSVHSVVRLGYCFTPFQRLWLYNGSPLCVRPFGFPNFSQLSFEILTWNLVYGFVLTWYRSSSTFVPFDLLLLQTYCPLQRFSFPNFSLPSFVILTWNLEYEFVLTRYRSSSTFVPFDKLLLELFPLCKNLVFQTFLFSLLWYWPEIWNMNLSWHDTNQVRLLLRLTYFYMSCCPLLKFRFPDFLSSFDIFIWNFIYEFILT